MSPKPRSIPLRGFLLLPVTSAQVRGGYRSRAAALPSTGTVQLAARPQLTLPRKLDGSATRRCTPAAAQPSPVEVASGNRQRESVARWWIDWGSHEAATIAKQAGIHRHNATTHAANQGRGNTPHTRQLMDEHQAPHHAARQVHMRVLWSDTDGS